MIRKFLFAFFLLVAAVDLFLFVQGNDPFGQMCGLWVLTGVLFYIVTDDEESTEIPRMSSFSYFVRYKVKPFDSEEEFKEGSTVLTVDYPLTHATYADFCSVLSNELPVPSGSRNLFEIISVSRLGEMHLTF